MFLLSGVALAMAQAPTIISFSPTTICQGEAITITGTNFTGATIVGAGSINASSFTVNSATTITAYISDQAGSGPVTVTTPKGDFTLAGLTVLTAPKPALKDESRANAPFTNCDGSAIYQLNVSNTSITTGSGNIYDINWGDGSPLFNQTDWPSGAAISHTYNTQGYFTIVISIKPPYGCTRTNVYQFYNGKNPIASLTTSLSTTGLCAPASIEFQIGNWSNNSAGTKYDLDFGDGSPHLILQHPLSAAIHKVTHQYTKSSCPDIDFKATLKAINGCFTTTYTLDQIIIRQKPLADFAIPNSACINTAVNLINQTVNGSSGNNFCDARSDFLWDFGDGTTSILENPPPHTYTVVKTYIVKLTASNTSCGNDVKTKQIIILPISPPPVVTTPVAYCEGQTATPLIATGIGLQWYTPSGVVTAPPIPSTTPASTTIYYVSQTFLNSCESPRVPITVTINRIPNAPGTSPVQLCQGRPATALTATGNGLLWYTTPTGTGSATAPTPTTAATGSTSYYVSQKINGCEGPKATIVVTVNALAVAPIVTSPVSYCQHQPAIPLVASGTNLLWYTTATGGTGSSTVPIPSTAVTGSKIYYVSQVTGCGEGPRSSITVNVNAGPSASISYTPSLLCNSSSTPVVVAFTGTPGGHYSTSPPGLTIDASTGTIIPLGAVPVVYTIKYTVSASGGCSDYIATTKVTVNSVPDATFTYPSMCSSDPATSVSFTGISGGTFTSTTGLVINPSTGTITPSASTAGDYNVTYTIAPSPPCAGFSKTIPVKITTTPSASIGYTPAILCNTSATPVMVNHSGSTGGTYSIAPAGLAINTNTGTITPLNAPPAVYTITYTIPGTGGCSNYSTSTTVKISGVPDATFTYPPMCSSDAAISVRLTGTSGGTFTSATGLVINAATGTITPATSIPGDYDVTYTIAATPPCAGFSRTIPVKITAAPSASISYTPAILCNTASAPVTVNHSGSTGGTYTILPGGLFIDAVTGTINPSGAIPNSYRVTYTVTGTGGCANYSTSTNIIINGAPTATINYNGSPFCGGTTIPQSVSLTGTQGGVFSSTTGLSVNATTGAINPSLSTPGDYTVIYTIADAPPCPGYVTNTNVRIDESPVVTFPMASQSICSGETAEFIPSSTVNNTTYSWSVTLPANVAGINSGITSGAISLSFTNTGTVSQLLTVRVIPTNPTQPPCSGAVYNLMLTVKPATLPPVTDTANLCMGAPQRVLTVAGTNIKWYDNNGVLLNAAPVINTNNSGQFKYYVTQSNSYGCESPKAEIVAVVHATAKIVSSTSINPTICGVPSGSIVLHVLDLNDGEIPNIPVLVHYDKFQISHTYKSSTDAGGKITVPLTAGTYTNISVETDNGCTSQKIPDVFILKDPTPPEPPVAGYNPPICSGIPLMLTALTATETTAGPIDYVWAGPAFGPYADTVRNTVVTFPSAAVSDAGTYVVYAIQNNCISLPTSFEIVVNQSPEKPVISTRTPLCIGDDLFLHAYSSIPGNATLNYTWKGPGEGFPVNAPNAEINKVRIEDAGMYTITVSSPETGCSSSTDTLIQIGGYPVARFGQDTISLPTGYRFILAPVITNATDAGILPIQNYTWTPSQDLSCNDALCSSPVATIKNNICYDVKVMNVYGCSGRDTVCVNVFCKNSQVFVPNAFAPGGNVPENKKLMVRATGISSVKSFRIFNRWGKMVFERSNFSPNSSDFGWDGMVNGKPADTGVYVYTVDVICENGIPYSFKGNVTLF